MWMNGRSRHQEDCELEESPRQVVCRERSWTGKANGDAHSLGLNKEHAMVVTRDVCDKCAGKI